MYYNGGTSLSSPLFVGAWAVLESATNNILGFAPSLIYPFTSQLYASATLRDVTTGNNGHYFAQAGYDNATGWGSFDIAKMLNFFGSATSTYTITASTDTGGTISPAGSITVNQGESKTFTITTSPGYFLILNGIPNITPTSLYQGGTCVGTISNAQWNADKALTNATFTTDPITASCTLTPKVVRYYIATFTPTVGGYISTPYAMKDGAIVIMPTVATKEALNSRDTGNFSIEADPGYKLDSVGGTCPGTIQGGGQIYSISYPTADCTVIPKFVPNTPYTVTASAGTGGSISPSGVLPANQGESKQFTVTADSKYALLLGNNNTLYDNSGTCGGTISNIQRNEQGVMFSVTYATNPITATCTVAPTFRHYYIVTPIASLGGSINFGSYASGAVVEGGGWSIAITPDSGYKLDSVGGTCPGTLSGSIPNYSYLVTYPAADCTVIPKFVPQ